MFANLKNIDLGRSFFNFIKTFIKFHKSVVI